MRITAIDGGGRSSERNLSLSIHWRKGKGLEFNEDEDSIEIDEKIMRVGEIIRKYETNVRNYYNNEYLLMDYL